MNYSVYDDTGTAAYGWVAACGESEKPFTWGDKEYLYMWNKVTGEHSYYNITDDVFEHNVEFN